MTLTLTVLFLGVIIFLFGMKRKQKMIKTVGGALFVLVLVYWTAILIK